MKRIGCVLLLFVAACLRKDGETCEQSEDCSSDHCEGNICIGGDCSGNSDCPSNFDCYHYDGDPIFGTGGGNRCRLLCDAAGACPSQWQCYAGNNVCQFVGPQIEVTVSNKTPQAHELVQFSAVLDPPKPCEWTWKFDKYGEFSGPTAELAFDPGGWSYNVTAKVTGSGNEYFDSSITACPIAGDPCELYGAHCCEGLTCNGTTRVCEAL